MPDRLVLAKLCQKIVGVQFLNMVYKINKSHLS